MEQKILFFDGVCHLCNGYIDFLVRFQTSDIFFAPLQGSTAAQILNPRPPVDSILYYKNKIILQKSTAVIESLCDATILFCWLKIFYLIPRFFRDAIYDYVARHRYQWFGKSETCRLPIESEKQFLLP